MQVNSKRFSASFFRLLERILPANVPKAVDGGGALARIVAIGCVVMLHIGSYFRIPAEAHSCRTIFAIMSGCCFWAVPAFVILSGYYTFPALSSMSATEYYRRRIGGVLRQTLFWSAIYTAMSLGKADAAAILSNWLHCRPLFHLWFVFMLLGLYVLAPACWRIMNGRFGPAIMLCFAIVVMSRPEMWNADLWQYPLLISIPYVPMFALGGLLAKCRITPVVGRCAMAFSAAYFAFVCWVSANGGKGAAYPFFHYLGFAGLWGGVSVTISFAYLGRFFSASASSLLFRASKLVFGVYLVHPLVMTAFEKVVPTAFYGNVLARAAIWCGVCTASFTLVAVIHKIPFVKRTV